MLRARIGDDAGFVYVLSFGGAHTCLWCLLVPLVWLLSSLSLFPRSSCVSSSICSSSHPFCPCLPCDLVWVSPIACLILLVFVVVLACCSLCQMVDVCLLVRFCVFVVCGVGLMCLLSLSLALLFASLSLFSIALSIYTYIYLSLSPLPFAPAFVRAKSS